MESIYLHGSEDVSRASHKMKEAAQQFETAVSQFSYELQQHRVWMDAWVERFRETMEMLASQEHAR